MKRVDLDVERRVRAGKGGARAVRREGMIPGIIYGGNDDPLMVRINTKQLTQTLHREAGESENILINAKFQDEDREVLTLMRSAQHDPLSGAIDHVDFQRVQVDKPIRTSVPVHPIGTAAGVRAGGLFELVRHDVEIECLPLDIPDSIDIDITKLEIGSAFHISDLPENDKYTVLTAEDQTLAVVTAPIVVTEEEETEDVAVEGEAEAEKKE